MTAKKTTAGVAGVSLLSAAGLWIAHAAGGLWDDVGRAVDDLPTPGETHDIAAALKQGKVTFDGLRTGDGYEQAVRKAACAAMNEFYSQSPSYAETKNAIYAELPADWGPGGYLNSNVSGKVDTATTAIAVMVDSNGGVASYYVRYCLR